ncbi:acetoacetate decarboxylase family protein [Amycolatopsis cihanbeyliensis]|uniref:Acetoacetate decarboxylase n=1 Tax=Amycolatopsis cihanbeyliensis TaxID=1128664 RepID=A0A542CSN1_AMYCI|nr:acetoacetate decarboxylase family protein [Amycolatopsis cihanbeyliensis]TQI93827.1 acetoacetate decarboxylase [Amycolatopsis cihanbeyliensis]
MPEYPPQPWHLTGQAYLSTWQVPAAELPRVPSEVDPLVVLGRALVVTAWIDYQQGGQLSYHELLACVAVRGPGTTATVTEIWVDSEASLAGGRELWGIPKEPAGLEFHHGRAFTGTAATGSDWIATAAFVPRSGPPVSTPSRFTVAQSADGAVLRSPVRARGRPRLASASWNLNPDGPLGYLAGRRPLFSAQLEDFDLHFGAKE